MPDYDFIIIGSGIAGLNFALQASKKGKVLIITKKKAANSSTNKAQGGIAAVLDKTDNFDKHFKDTLVAGCYHNNEKAVQYMVKNGPEAIKRLIEYGVNFTEHKGQLQLTREGGHDHKRIAFIGDYTGQEIEKSLLRNIKQASNITLLEHSFAAKLLVKEETCYGVQIFQGKLVKNIFARRIVIATGGMGQIYRYTTNPRISTGDGFAIAKEVGCKFKDMEYIQFHPTAFDHHQNPKFLISEAVRGEGAILINSDGKAFMKKYHPKADLAPRDIVTRAIFAEQKRGQVCLDITHEKEDFLRTRFPKIFEKLQKHGLNLASDLIPITPVAHYCCGGIQINFEGETNIQNLFAFGEVAHTGVHGANRLASNSLLEALVFSSNIAKNLNKGKSKTPKFSKPKLSFNISETNQIKRIKQKIKQIMWDKVGIIRNQNKLKIALEKLKKLEEQLSEIKSINQETVEANNMLETAILITEAALKNTKSLGCHYLEN